MTNPDLTAELDAIAEERHADYTARTERARRLRAELHACRRVGKEIRHARRLDALNRRGDRRGEQEEIMPDHFDRAMHWLDEADQRHSPEAGRECLAAATVHALLAIAEAITQRCDHCAATPTTETTAGAEPAETRRRSS